MAKRSKEVGTGQKLPVYSSNLPLPFGQLWPKRFEEMCLWLVRAEGYEDPQYVGEGGKDSGRDVTAYETSGHGKRLWYFQCKRYKEITPATLKGEVDKIDKFAKRNPDKAPAGIVFVTSAVVAAPCRDKVGRYCSDRGYEHKFWAHGELDMLVKSHPEVLREFFDARDVVPPSVNALHQLPTPSREFTGRDEELAELMAKVRQGGAMISCVHGMGGIGKTELALLLADRLKDEYPVAQIFLNLMGTSDSPISPARAMAHVIHAFRPDAMLPEDAQELSGAYLSVLDGKRAILLMDNALDGDQVRPLLPPSSCLLLVTSRRQFSLPGLHSMNLDTLPLERARELLLRIAPRIKEHADQIAELCGCLPLALCAAGHMLNVRRNLKPAEYSEQLRDEKTRLGRLGTEGVEISVEASLGLSYRQLPGDTARVFRMSGVFTGSFDGAAAEAVCQDEDHRHVSELVRFNMVQFDESTARYRLHDLVRVFAERKQGKAERTAAQRRHAGHYKDVSAVADDLYLKGGEGVRRGLALFDAERQNIEAGQVWAAASAGADEKAAALCNDYPDAGVYCLALRLHPSDRIRWMEAALAAASKLKDRQAEGVHLGNLGIAYAALGEMPKAIEYHEQALAIDREIGDRRGEGQDLGNLGNAYADLGEPRKAIDYYEQRLKIAREIGDRMGEGNVLGNLANAYAALGETRKAIEYHEQALTIDREIGDRRGEGADLWNMSLALRRLGRRVEAIRSAEQALAIFEQIEDPNAAKVRRGLEAWRGGKGA